MGNYAAGSGNYAAGSGNYAAGSGNFLSTFRDNLSAPYSGVKNPKKTP